MVHKKSNKLAGALLVKDKSSKKPAKNYFSPSLKLQRQAFCLEQLRLHGVRSVFEIGCGEGDLLAALCEPASHTDDFPLGDMPIEKLSKSDIRWKIPEIPGEERELHIDRLAGIDIDAERIQQACEITRPPRFLPAIDSKEAFGRRERWEHLRVDLWQGSFAHYEESLDGYEAVVASEVIEHLHDESLGHFGPIILGRYRPRLVIVTTPNYDFQPLFPQYIPGEVVNKNRTPDPTGRTNRIFRDSDHKFEFSASEFEAWANGLCQNFDYTVSFAGVGHATAYLRDPNADPQLCATQCAVFKRLYANEQERAPRSPRSTPLAFLSALPPALAPTLRATHIYRVELEMDPPSPTNNHHPHKKALSTSSQLRRLIAECFVGTQPDVRLRDLWSQSRLLRRAAAGRIGAVFEAALEASDLYVIDVRPGDDFDEPLAYADDAVWIMRKPYAPQSPNFKKSWADEVEEELGVASVAYREKGESDDSDEPRGKRGGRRPRLKRDASDEESSDDDGAAW